MRNVILSLLLLATTACTSYSRPYTTPTAPEVLKAVSSRPIEGLRAKGKVDTFTSRGRLKVNVFMLADRLGRLRFDAVTPPPMNATVLLVTSNGSQFIANDRDHNLYFVGPTQACAVAQVLGIRLSPAELFSLLIGENPWPVAGGTLSWDSDCGCEVVTTTDGKRTVKLWVLGHRGRANWRLEKAEVTTPNSRVHVEYRGWKKINGRLVPMRMRITQKGVKGDAVFAWSRLELDPEMEPDAFQQVPPVDAEIRRVGNCDVPPVQLKQPVPHVPQEDDGK
ncbi:DUF4292 domain-containing protein [Myxococcota bacterium]|nr:DUF4292 domain-containing protein [Myxococcota bacterium]